MSVPGDLAREERDELGAELEEVLAGISASCRRGTSAPRSRARAAAWATRRRRRRPAETAAVGRSGGRGERRRSAGEEGNGEGVEEEFARVEGSSRRTSGSCSSAPAGRERRERAPDRDVPDDDGRDGDGKARLPDGDADRLILARERRERP